ncbi:MarR family transcriptional regulator [Rhodococcus sp. DMU1]|uniref:MarR family winged helix-turn-helix transcriptional regulator n=1 Tax=Rhodococcus sp. DMU1 TaxID=2722825 RepID=UPI00143E9B3E|nr:MarR family transcriptional regulator [Rhodococcus sp. DMU1]QIX53871.1 MarR family transcriptional regulator [Rhodococcus sp. DMU1]
MATRKSNGTKQGQEAPVGQLDLQDPLEVAMTQLREVGFPNSEMFELMTSLYRLQSMVQMRMEEALKPFGTNLTCYFALVTLSIWKNGLRHKELADYLKIHPTTVTLVVDALSRLDLVERRPYPMDRRVSLVFITEDGRALLARASAAMAAYNFGLPDSVFDIDRGLLLEQLAHLRVALGDTVRDQTVRTQDSTPD